MPLPAWALNDNRLTGGLRPPTIPPRFGRLGEVVCPPVAENKMRITKVEPIILRLPHVTEAVDGTQDDLLIRIETDGVMRSVDPAIEPADGSERALAARVMPSIFESLVAPDGARGLRPVLAVAWEHDDRNVRWRFRLRQGVRFHDGSVLQPPQVAAIIGAQQRSWRVGSSGDAVVIETDRAHPRGGAVAHPDPERFPEGPPRVSPEGASGGSGAPVFGRPGHG